MSNIRPEDLGEDFSDVLGSDDDDYSIVTRNKRAYGHGSVTFNDAYSWRTGIAGCDPFIGSRTMKVPRAASPPILPAAPRPAPPSPFDIETPAMAERRQHIINTTSYVFCLPPQIEGGSWWELYRNHGAEAILVHTTNRTRLITIELWIAYCSLCQARRVPPTMRVASASICTNTPWGFYTLPPLDNFPEVPREHLQPIREILQRVTSQ